jgi:hypothetical protein
MLDEKGKAPSAESALSEMSSAGCFDNSGTIKPPRPNTQIKFQNTAELTCAAMRGDELRGLLIREISRTMAIGLQVQAALLDGDDDAALANLRRHWIVTRASISPLAAELVALRKAGAPP